VARERAKTFAERLPPILPKEEEDISELSDDLVDVLYPGRRVRPFRIEIVFDAFEGEGAERALGIARKSRIYSEGLEGGVRRHRASFESKGALLLRDLFEIVGPRPGTDVLVNGKEVPYAREIWLPLFWIFPDREE
jgi:hypothetical protein